MIERHWRFLGRGDVAAASRDRRSPKRRPALLAQVRHQRKERLQIVFGDRVHELAQPFPICDFQAFPWTPNWRRNRRAPPAPPPTNNRVATTPLRIINTALRRQGPHGCRRTRTRPCREGLRPRPKKSGGPTRHVLGRFHVRAGGCNVRAGGCRRDYSDALRRHSRRARCGPVSNMFTEGVSLCACGDDGEK